jgi:hypothetical protein
MKHNTRASGEKPLTQCFFGVTKTVTKTLSKHLIVSVRHDTILFISMRLIPYLIKN